MPTMLIDKSISINKPVDKIYDLLSNFDHWTPWSPWLISEPSAKVTVGEDKKSYRWDGERVGSGEMKIIHEVKNESILIDLNFLKPWKSFAKVEFIMKPSGDSTTVHWTMESKMPFFMFFMKNLMTALIGLDYERGLRMLKEYCEDGKVHSELIFTGEEQFQGSGYVGMTRTTSMDKLGDLMSKDYTDLHEFLKGQEDLINGQPFTIYHKWDMVKRMCSYTSCVPVTKVPSNLKSGIISGTYPSTKVFTIEHIGPYHHIGNAWSTLYNMERAKKFKRNKNLDPIEIYLNSPLDTDPKELRSKISFAVK